MLYALNAFCVMLNRRRHAARPTEEHSKSFSLLTHKQSVRKLLTTTHPRWHLKCSMRDHQNITSRTSKNRKFRMRRLGSQKVRSSVPINPSSSSAYPKPVRNRTPQGSPSVRICLATHSTGRNILRVLRLSAAITAGNGYS